MEILDLLGNSTAKKSNCYTNTVNSRQPAVLQLWNSPASGHKSIILDNLRLQKFQATFAIRRSNTAGGTVEARMVFDHKGEHETEEWVSLRHQSSGGALATAGKSTDATFTWLAGGSDPAVTSLVGTDVLWARVQSDGSTLKVWFIKNGTPTDSDWSAIAGSPALSTSSGLSFSGGGIGFTASTTGETATVDDLTIKSWDSVNSAWVTEAVEPFTLDGSGYSSDTLTYDNNGNLIYDGTQGYIYDAWNRQIKTAHAYNDGTAHAGQVSTTCGYDASGRRITKAVANTGSWDATYHYYYSKGYQIVEERNGSDQSIKDHVWGLTYVDEILQTRINTTPSSTATWSNYYLLQDANFNVQGVTDSSGTLVERYEYGAYGSRQVFTSAGANDPGLYASADASVKVITSGSVTQPYGLNEIGHQGLFHDEASNLVYNRARMLHPTLGRFMQNDPLGYVDGLNAYQVCRSSGVNCLDFPGLETISGPTVVSPSPATRGPLWTPTTYAPSIPYQGAQVLPILEPIINMIPVDGYSLRRRILGTWDPDYIYEHWNDRPPLAPVAAPIAIAPVPDYSKIDQILAEAARDAKDFAFFEGNDEMGRKPIANPISSNNFPPNPPAPPKTKKDDDSECAFRYAWCLYASKLPPGDRHRAWGCPTESSCLKCYNDCKAGKGWNCPQPTKAQRGPAWPTSKDRFVASWPDGWD